MQYKYATADDMALLIRSREETLRAVNHLPEDYAFSEEFLEASREYFREGDQTTVLALEEGRIAGCATMCYIDMMPTFSHPSGRRAHLMNVYTHPDLLIPVFSHERRDLDGAESVCADFAGVEIGCGSRNLSLRLGSHRCLRLCLIAGLHIGSLLRLELRSSLVTGLLRISLRGLRRLSMAALRGLLHLLRLGILLGVIGQRFLLPGGIVPLGFLLRDVMDSGRRNKPPAGAGGMRVLCSPAVLFLAFHTVPPG